MTSGPLQEIRAADNERAEYQRIEEAVYFACANGCQCGWCRDADRAEICEDCWEGITPCEYHASPPLASPPLRAPLFREVT